VLIRNKGNQIGENYYVNSKYLKEPKQGGVLNLGAGNKPIEGAYNISNPNYPMAPGVHSGDANNLSKIATASQSKIIMENPYGFKPFNDEVIRALSPNGTIIVKGTLNNGSLKNIEKIAESKGFKLEKKSEIPNSGYSLSSGKPLNESSLTEYIFKRK